MVYAVFVILGGLMGLRAGSKVSLYAGGGSGLMLLIAWGVTFVALRPGLWIGSVIAVLLAVTFAKRFFDTRKFMPSGMMLIVSIAAAALLVRQAWTLGS